MRRLLEIAAIIVATLFPTHGLAANTWGVDFSDLWWNPAESGWGANIAHQREIIFMTMFVYGQDSKPKWYVASSMASRGGETSHTFDGQLYEASGPFLGTPNFNPASVTMRVVGTATLQFSAIHRGTLTYSVDGVTVSNSIERQTFRLNELSGTYRGAQVGTKTNCGASTGTTENSTLFTITHSVTDISITASLSDANFCTYTGTYSQFGKMGQIDGTFSCINGSNGLFFAAGIEASDKGFLGRFFADFGGGCIESGLMGGVKR